MTFVFDARVASRGFDVSLEVKPGETVAVLGPNGAGKSTLLDLAAGLLRADSGRAVLDDTVLFDAVGGGRFTPPHERGVSLLAQQPLLFPHLSVLENVAFGPRSSGVSRLESRETARHWLAEVEALDLADRRPTQLSGGQAQRIAVARALASDPKLLLLDEPLAALDVAVAPALRRMLRRVLAGRTVLIVTHDILDAFTLADRVVVLDHGRIVEQGPTRDVLERPRSRFAAGLAALNLLVGVRTERGIRLDDGAEIAGASSLSPGTPAAAAVRPPAVRVSLDEPAEVNRLRGEVLDVEPRGDLVRVRSRHLAADVAPAVVADLDLAPGSTVWFAFDPAAVQIYAG
ncbi:ABC transporter ATP-binding protein [Conyzicola nivalis]|uniref:Molybdenum ABC transporter ATP-binding protein n=1 Tax=Conyzicola nivalis TaxID=1477021 RepID=A0A916SJG3_9MICO|nr:ATP-binding cassette domain-containing protein [Conyzicola nivalis]GGB02445.1 molybdenum ABC transporter ATP-binding protein [Conyzicola nivalis]